MPDSFYQPETLGFFIHGSRHHVVEKDCSFDVEAQIKFNQVQTARGYNFTRKFCLNSSNEYEQNRGIPNLAKIEVAFIFAFFKLNFIQELLNPQNGYLVDNALELFVDITITESETEQIKS